LRDVVGGVRVGKRILIVDDDRPIRLLYEEELEDEGYEVRVASNGEEALAVLDGFNPDVVTLDVKMRGGIDGIETLRTIKARRPSLPVILCTAYQHYKADFGCWACDAYVVKSSDLAELKAAIRKALRGAAA
jgi:DNA-binding response OmpR family regulator